jgi:RsiW-degrading membrane proteinase PrsW (M82 family)
MMNEAWYSGWSATVCSKETCLAVPTAMGSSGQITMTIPPGTWKLRVQFHEPHQTIAWALFYGGVLAAFALAVIAFVHTRRRTARAVPQQSERN